MSDLVVATITETTSTTVHNLICDFQYIPYIAKKRVAYLKTAKGIVRQESNPLYSHGEDKLEWKFTITSRTTVALFLSLYALDDTFTFTGYWGEEYLINFDDKPEVVPRAGYFELRGEFRVLCVTLAFAPTETCP